MSRADNRFGIVALTVVHEPIGFRLTKPVFFEEVHSSEFVTLLNCLEYMFAFDIS